MAGDGQPYELGGGHEQPLVTGLAAPGDVPAGQRPLDLAVDLLQPVEQGGMASAQVAERLERRGVGPRASTAAAVPRRSGPLRLLDPARVDRRAVLALADQRSAVSRSAAPVPADPPASAPDRRGTLVMKVSATDTSETMPMTV